MQNVFYLILPDIRSAHNVGAMFRTADAFGVSKLFLVGYTAAPPKPQIDKVSLGAETWMPWEKVADFKKLILDLKKKGVSIIGLEKTDGSIAVGDAVFPTDRSVALIVGNEVDGIDPDILMMCDEVVHISMYGKKESLNVSVAAGIAMYVLRKRI
jgi:tRNA G18 (ribose-2'-O)-methylase SpoU